VRALAIRLVLVEAEQAEEVEALGRAVERVIRAARGEEGSGGEWFAITGLGRAAIGDGATAEVRALGDGGEAAASPLPGVEAVHDYRGRPRGVAEDTTTDEVRMAVEAEAGEAARTVRPRRNVRRDPDRRAAAAADGPFVCEVEGCGRAFGSKHALGVHRRRKHGLADGVNAEKERRRERGGPHRCEVEGCGRSFGSTKGLGRHRRAVHGIAGSSSAAAYRKARQERGGATRVERDGLAVDSEGRVECAVCGKRMPARGYGKHMSSHEARGEGAGALARATVGPRRRPRTRIYDGVPASLARGRGRASVLSPPSLDSGTVGGTTGGDDEDDDE
jgi:hypothetical protein